MSVQNTEQPKSASQIVAEARQTIPEITVAQAKEELDHDNALRQIRTHDEAGLSHHRSVRIRWTLDAGGRDPQEDGLHQCGKHGWWIQRMEQARVPCRVG